MQQEAPQRQQKLRSACDQCSAAKIKCDKQRPTCERCANNQYACSYSLSRRCGKQSWAKRAATQRGLITSTTPDASTGNHSKSEKLSLDAGLHSALLEHTLSNGDSDDAIARWLGPVDNHGAGLQAPLQWSNSSAGMDFNMANHPVSAPQALALYSMMDDARQGMEHLQSSDTSQVGRTSQTEEFAATTLSPGSFFEKIHDCEQRASATLQSLDCSTGPHVKSQLEEDPEPFMSPSTASSSLYHGGSTSIGPTLDKVLHANKAALGEVAHLLECPCAQQPHLALLYASIISKILLRYRIAAHVQFPTSPGAHFKQVSSSFTQNLPTPMKAGSFMRSGGVLPTSIQVGVFDIDEEDQITLQRGLLLRETRKVERVIEKMAALDGGHSMDDDCAGGTTASWYGISSSKLRIELHETLKEVKEFATPRMGGE